MSSKKGKVKLYHYTDKKGVEGIKKDNIIMVSTDTATDAAFGEGVYLTSMGPSNHPKEIVQNNYDGGSVVNNPQMRAKVGYVVEVELDREAVEKVSDQRDVYLYRGNLDLNKHRHSIYRNPNTQKKELSTWRSEEGTTVDYYFNKRQEFMSTKVHIDEIMKPNYTFDYMAYRRFHDPDFTIWDHLIVFFAPLLILGILYVFLKLREMKKSFQLRLSERCGE